MLNEALPGIGDRTRPAIEAAGALLADHQWHPWPKVVAGMVDASDLLPVSASNRLHELVRTGVLKRRGRHPDRFLRIARETQ